MNSSKGKQWRKSEEKKFKPLQLSTQKREHAACIIYDCIVIILNLWSYKSFPGLTDICSYLNFNLVNKKLSLKNMILQHFYFYPSFTLIIIKTFYYFSRHIFEIHGEQFFSPESVFFSLRFLIHTLASYLYALYQNCTCPEINRKQPEFKLSRKTLFKKILIVHDMKKQQFNSWKHFVFGCLIKLKSVPALSNYCFSYVNFIGKNASLHMQQITPRLCSKRYMVQVS